MAAKGDGSDRGVSGGGSDRNKNRHSELSSKVPVDRFNPALIKGAAAIVVMVLYVGIGALGMHLIDGMGWMGSIYITVMPFTTIGLGQLAFKSTLGRFCGLFLLFASVILFPRALPWLPIACLAKLTMAWRASRKDSEAKITSASASTCPEPIEDWINVLGDILKEKNFGDDEIQYISLEYRRKLLKIYN